MQAMFLMLIVTATGCTSLPDIGPFADATHQLKAAVAQSGSTVSDELRYTEGGKETAEQLDEAWKARNQAFEAIAAYSDSLEAIVSSGNQGAQAAGELADSIQEFAKAAGIAIPASPAAINAVSDSIKLLVKYIAITRAAKSLEEAMVKAQPAVEQIVKLIVKDLKDIDDIFRAANKLIEINFNNSYATRISYRKALEDFVQTANIANANDAVLKRLAQVNELLDSTNSWYSEYQQGLEKNQKRLRVGRALIKTAQASVQQWVTAHKQVVNALKNRRPVSTKSLLEAAVEIQYLIKRVREL
jgi:tetratricopeptide (TPR) repeat protein